MFADRQKIVLIRLIILVVGHLSFVVGPLRAEEVSHTAMDGSDSVPAEYFRKWYHRSDLVYYLEALNDHTIVENHAVGQWWVPDRLNLGIAGLPCTMSTYSIDGMRVDDRFAPGNTVFVPNMQQYDMLIDTHHGQLQFRQDTAAPNYVQAQYNFGQVGNGAPALGTAAIVNITHRTAMQSAETFQHVSARRHQAGAGNIDAAYTFRDSSGNAYRQHLYAIYGQRLLTRENEHGLITDDPYYRAAYYKVQADGLLPVRPNKAFSRIGYRLNFSGKEDGGSEYLYNWNEVYDHKNYTGQIYAQRPNLTTGLTWATNVVHHRDREFSKNILDIDGESFAPWVADGQTHELSWTVNYSQPVLPWLSVHVRSLNSLILFRPEEENYTNNVYFRSPVATADTALYRYEWSSRAYAGGLLENTIGLQADYTICRQLDMHAHLDFTLDGMLLGGGKSKVSPNWQAGINCDLHPCRGCEMGLSVAHERMPYNTDYLRYFSNDYMNARVYLAGTNTLCATTGGQYHTYRKNLMQTSYLELHIPIRFVFRTSRGQHEIVLQNAYRKFFNVWHTYYAGGAEANGSYQTFGSQPVYIPALGEKQYEVGTTPELGMNILMNSPYYFSQLTRYTFTGKKVTVGLSWQSMQAAGYTGLGNGPNSNTMGVLSETTANPNTQMAVANPKGQHAGVGRMDLDKGFVARFYLGYNICQWVQAGLTIKWTDGKPFTAYHYYYDRSTCQMAILPETSRGTNPTDGHFGTRHGAVYNIDLHLQGQWTVRGVPMRLNVECYNIWDFCHDLAELSFAQDRPDAFRASIIMNVPTGILATYTVEL